MKQKSIAESMKDFAHDKELMQKTHDSAALRAKKRERERRAKRTRSKQVKDIIFFTFYGLLLVFFTSVVSLMFVQTMS